VQTRYYRKRSPPVAIFTTSDLDSLTALDCTGHTLTIRLGLGRHHRFVYLGIVYFRIRLDIVQMQSDVVQCIVYIYYERRCGVVGSTLAFGSMGHGFESE